MKKSIIVGTVLLLVLSTSGFSATLQSLNKSQVAKIFENNTITTIPLITMNSQLINNSFTGFFSKDNKVKGQLANKPDNDEPQTDEGSWMVKPDGAICVTWEHWNNNKPVCVTVYHLANGVILVNQQTKKFESLILNDNIKTGDQTD